MGDQRRQGLEQGFDPSGVGLDNGNFCGLPFDYGRAGIILIGVPWEVTVSYNAGTAQGPAAVLSASPQLDLYDLDNPQGWRTGIFMVESPAWIAQQNQKLRPQAAEIIAATERGESISASPHLSALCHTLNQACESVNQWLYAQAQAALGCGKRVGVIGGDHSVPLGYLRALATVEPNFGILHIDAHADLRQAYQGFQFSHASIMHNALAIPQVSKLVQVGIRDLCEDEVSLIGKNADRVVTYYDRDLKGDRYRGIPWLTTCDAIVANLPQHVYVSFDVDGLDPKLCPNTGTPVPGGLELEEVFWLLRTVINSGRTLIGFDVSEVGNGEWDGNVAARAVYKLCNLMAIGLNGDLKAH